MHAREGVVTGAADGYARMARKPACTLLHLGPGLGNGLANLHNASRAQVPGLRVGDPGPCALDLFEIGRPHLDWVSLAKGMGVPGTRVTSLEAFAKALREGFESQGPMLIEVPCKRPGIVTLPEQCIRPSLQDPALQARPSRFFRSESEALWG